MYTKYDEIEGDVSLPLYIYQAGRRCELPSFAEERLHRESDMIL